jgi:hypothetical protein
MPLGGTARRRLAGLIATLFTRCPIRAVTVERLSHELVPKPKRRTPDFRPEESRTCWAHRWRGPQQDTSLEFGTCDVPTLTNILSKLVRCGLTKLEYIPHVQSEHHSRGSSNNTLSNRSCKQIECVETELSNSDTDSEVLFTGMHDMCMQGKHVPNKSLGGTRTTNGN